MFRRTFRQNLSCPRHTRFRHTRLHPAAVRDRHPRKNHHRRACSHHAAPPFLGADVRLRPRHPLPARELPRRPAGREEDHRLPVRPLPRHLPRRHRRLQRRRARQSRLQLLLRRSDLRRPARQRRPPLRRAQLHAQEAGRHASTTTLSGTSRSSLRPRTTRSGTRS